MNMNREIELSVKGDLFLYELVDPKDETRDGEVRSFRDETQESADLRARALARRERCGIRRKAVF